MDQQKMDEQKMEEQRMEAIKQSKRNITRRRNKMKIS